MESFSMEPMSGLRPATMLPKCDQATAPYCTSTVPRAFRPESLLMGRTCGSPSTMLRTFPKCSWASKFESSQKSEVITLEELYETFADWNHCSLMVLADNSADGT